MSDILTPEVIASTFNDRDSGLTELALKEFAQLRNIPARRHTGGCDGRGARGGRLKPTTDRVRQRTEEPGGVHGGTQRGRSELHWAIVLGRSLHQHLTPGA